MSFDYFYGQQSDLFTFYRVPKVLFTNERFWNSQRQSAVAAAAYQSGEKLFCEYDQQVKHYPEKRGIVHNEILLPANAPPEYADRNTLWNAAEAVEKQWNSQLARRWVLTIPREIPPDQYAVLVREFCEQQFVSKGMIADFAIHDPHPPGHNPHAHVMEKGLCPALPGGKADIEELKDLFGDEFVDFNLVFCSSNGKPIEGQVINRAFNKLIEENGLPKVVFHSLRHSSITYKLKLNGGDMKSVQGDSGHAQVKMVADVYSHIIDDDRRLNAERMEAAFYSGRQATPEPVQPATTESSADDKELLLKLLQNPEMAALLKSLAKTL